MTFISMQGGNQLYDNPPVTIVKPLAGADVLEAIKSELIGTKLRTLYSGPPVCMSGVAQRALVADGASANVDKRKAAESLLQSPAAATWHQAFLVIPYYRAGWPP